MKKLVLACSVLVAAAAAALPLGAAGEKIDYEAINKIKQQGLNAQTSQVMDDATIAASFAYLAANRDEKLPRKPAPQAVAGRGTGQ